ncbi:hypothetical protein P4B35_14575 [Pontiellaceae bacterium B12227]|nr:hypothetical protein [Pontiellaceae bacterium B12227]
MGRWLGGLQLLLLLSACGPSTEERAVLLYDQALPHAHAMLSAENYSTAFEEYSTAAGSLDALLAEPTDFSTNIVGIPLNEFIALGDQLRPLAAAEQDILACATLLTMSNDAKDERCFDFIKIAEAHIDTGNTEEAINLLTMATAAANAKTNLLSRAHAYTRIAGVYDAVGATDPANRAASTAERLATASTPESSIVSTISRTYSLSQAAMRHLSAGNKERGHELMRLAAGTLNMKPSDRGYSMRASSLANDFDEGGYFDCAMEILQKGNHEDDFLFYPIRRMAGRNRTLDELTQLAEFTMTIKKEHDRDRTLSTLAAHYAAAGQFMSARMLQAAMESKFSGDDKSWLQTVSGYATNRQINAAFKTIDLIHKEDDRAEALLKIATALSEQGHRQYAANTVASALNIALTPSFWPDYEVIGKVATTYAQLGYPEQSKELFEQYTAEARAFTRPWKKADALNDLAFSLIQLNQMNEAAELLLLARDALKNDPQKRNKSGLLLNYIAENLARAGQYVEALNTAELIENDSRHKEGVYEDLALLFTAVGANDFMEQCIVKVTNDYELANLLEDLVEIHLRQDQPERALELADRMEKTGNRHDAQALTAVYYAERDEFTCAFETTRLITNAYNQVSALIDIATATAPPRALRPEEIKSLSLIVADQYPMDEFWTERGLTAASRFRRSCRRPEQ